MKTFFQLSSIGLFAVALTACEGGRSSEQLSARTETPAKSSVVRFIAVGDTGSASDGQYAVGQAIAEVCATKGCDFALGLGDNIYETGAIDVLDPQFDEKFEIPFMPIDLPFYMALGNHDNSEFFAGDGAGNARGDIQVAYHYRDQDYPDHPRLTNRWQMPARYYKFSAGQRNGSPLVEFFAIDTTQPAGGFPDSDENYTYNTYGLAQLEWLKQSIDQSSAQWKLVFGHHPYVSNGSHGNAGHYDGVPSALLPVLSGQRFKDFLEESICDKADYYITGHDHDLQWLKPQSDCGRTTFVVSGAGSKQRSLVNRDENPHFYQAGDVFGFFWMEIDGDRLSGEIYEVDPSVDSLGIRAEDGSLAPRFRMSQPQAAMAGLQNPENFSGVPFIGIPASPGANAGADYQQQTGPLEPVQDALSDGLNAFANALPDTTSATAIRQLAASATLALDAPDVMLRGLTRLVETGNPDTARTGAALATQALLASIAELEAAAPTLAALSPRYETLPELFHQYRSGMLAMNEEDSGNGLARLLAPVIQLVRNIENIVDALEEETDPIPVVNPTLGMVAKLLLDVTDILVAAGQPGTSGVSQEVAASVDNLLRGLLLRVIPIEDNAPPEVVAAAGLIPSFLGTALLLVLQEVSYILDPLLLPIIEPISGLLDAILSVILPPA